MATPSFIARIAECILRITKPKYMDSKEKVQDFLAEKSKDSDKPVKSIFKSFDFNGMQVFTYGNKNLKMQYCMYMEEPT